MGDKSNGCIEKVLITTDTLGGIWTYAVGLARQLSLLDIRVALATMGKKLSPAQWQDVENIPGLTIHESQYKLEWMDDPWPDVEQAGQWLLELEKSFQPDIVHLNSFSFGALPFNSPVMVVCHSCVYTWWHGVKDCPPPEENWSHYYRKVYKGLHAADQIVAISQAFAREISQIYCLDEQKINVIYNGLNPADYSSGHKKKLIFGMGRIWDEAKNFGMAETFAEKVKWPVKIAGSLQHPAIGSASDLKNVALTGNLSGKEVRRELSEAAIFILPALYEPFGLSALEAAFSGCALLLSDISTLREIWQDAALYADPKDPDAWHSSLDLLIKDNLLRQQLREKAFVKAHEFNIQTMAGKYIRLYNKIKNLKPVVL